MKKLSNFLQEGLKIGKDYKRNKYIYFPDSHDELAELVVDLIQKHSHDAVINLNIINTEKIEDMSEIFWNIKVKNKIDISKWDTSNVKYMNDMFRDSTFNGDISEWDVSNVVDMDSMFRNSTFNGDISNWNVSNVHDMSSMFLGSVFNQDISRWNVSNVESMSSMFDSSEFNQDISDWDVKNLTHFLDIFRDSRFKQNITPWLSKIEKNYKNQLENIIKSKHLN